MIRCPVIKKRQLQVNTLTVDSLQDFFQFPERVVQFPGEVTSRQAAGTVLVAGKRRAFRGFQADYFNMDRTGHAGNVGRNNI
jgi:hypothetical protein